MVNKMEFWSSKVIRSSYVVHISSKTDSFTQSPNTG